jgi:hypothetical protein
VFAGPMFQSGVGGYGQRVPDELHSFLGVCGANASVLLQKKPDEHLSGLTFFTLERYRPRFH